MAYLLRKRFAYNLKNPQDTIIGLLVKKKLIEWNSHLEENAAKLCRIKPHHNVLEVGYGPGVGLRKALHFVKDGPGKIFGVDVSTRMTNECRNLFKKEIANNKLILYQTSVENIPCSDNTFDRVFHVDCYYFWSDFDASLRELYRVMKPFSYMVVPVNFSRINKLVENKLLRYGRPDPMKFVTTLERQGFVDIKIEKFWDKAKKEDFHVIFARIKEKIDTTGVS